MPRLTFGERVRQHDREIAEIRKLVLTGMEIMVNIEKGIKDLQAAQKRTEKALERFIGSLERGRPVQ
jgi:hypothetical protein